METGKVFRPKMHASHSVAAWFSLGFPLLEDWFVSLVFLGGFPPCECNFICLMATVVASLLASCVNKVKDIIIDEAILILGVKKELREVLQRVELIRCCIYDAEKRGTKELAVNNWLGQLRDVIYDVDEILDVARCKGSKLLPDHPSSSSGKSVASKGLSMSSCFCNIGPRRDVAVRIRNLNKKIENIANDKIFSTFNSSTLSTRNGPTSKLIRSSNLVEPNLVGKEIIHSSRKLVNLVLAQKENKSYKIAIVGTGGVGKTTLAQKIYSNQKIKGNFKIQAWVCVSQEYNEVALLKEVLRNIGVHNEQGRERSVEFKKHRDEIVRKCGCLPLAIKVTASALASRDLTENGWRRYLDKFGSQNMLSEEIEGALYLSYDELTIYLKQCFLYCALYGEDVIIEREVVTWLWIAEGFIEEREGQLLKEIAEEYYHELILRNLLEPDILSCDQAKCKMHDLLRQLACNISREECFIGDIETLRGENLSKLRRVTAVIKKDTLVLPRVDKLEVKVRTFLTMKGPWRIEDTLFKRFLLLRVLVLNYSLVQSIPDYIGKLIHVRLLNLNYTSISCLPESIGSLKNLQVLSLRWCHDLHYLPSAVTQLSSLRCLDLFGTKINQVPKGIGKLKLLNLLGDYPVGDGSDNAVVQGGWNLKELSSLSKMRHLALVKLERAAHYSINGVLKDKKHLKELVLSWTKREEGSYSEEDVSNTEKVFEQLIPPYNLEDLSIVRFFGRQYPTWFGTTYLSSLIYLILVDIPSCVHLPAIGQLSNLKYLKIEGAYAVTKVGPEFVGCEKADHVCNELVAFPKLEWLIFMDMPS
ncbi:hypothetical protein VPH35_049767 [Triticum aestivum]